MILRFSERIGGSFTTFYGNVFICTNPSGPAPYVYTNAQPIVSIGFLEFSPFGSDAFYQYLTYVLIPLSVTTIGSGSFAQTLNLTNVQFEGSSRDFPSSGDELSPSLIFSDAAFTSSGLTSINLPNRLTNIDVQTFSNCPNLTKVIFPNNMNLQFY